MLFEKCPSPSLSFRSTTRRSTSVSTSNSCLSDVTVATTMSVDLNEDKSILDVNIRKEFAQIVQRWRNKTITEEDTKYLESISVTDEEYLLITEDFGLRHGVELVNHHIRLNEYPTAVHEFMSRQMDRWVDRSFGDRIAMLGSTSTIVHYLGLML